jgi:hypothetical protein
MWPAVSSIVYYVGIGVHALLAALIGQRLGLRARVPLAVSACYLLGMTVGAKALSDIREGSFDPAALLRREHFVAGGLWGGPAVYLGLSVPVVSLMTRRRGGAAIRRHGETETRRSADGAAKRQGDKETRGHGEGGMQRRAGLDLIALAAPIPMAVAKAACLCAGCCHGMPTALPWAITFPPGNRLVPGGIPLHPTQIYDMLALLLIAAVLWRLNRPRWRGTLLLWFVALYVLARLLTEFTRGDLARRALVLWGPLTSFQWLCAAAAAGCAVALLLHARRSTPAHGFRSPGRTENPGKFD